jgi:F420-dependent oxidoreductase-like protein
VPSKALTGQFDRWPGERAALSREFDVVHRPGRVRLVPPVLYAHHDRHHRAITQEDDPMTDDAATDTSTTLRFGLTISSFTWPGEVGDIAATLARIAADAEEAGFDSIWVMDHVIQIPQVGRQWEPMLDSTTALGFLAAATERVRLGTLVTGISYRNVAHVGKIAATLDVLSGGRAMCGLGAAWFDREHTAYGWRMPPLAERFELLEDALELFPLLWGPGAPAFSGRRIEIAEAICYPRPIQERIPILVGGSGERRTLDLVARHADACNLFGEPDIVRHKVQVLRDHCHAAGRDPDDVTVTQLSSLLCGTDDEIASVLAMASGDGAPPEVAAERLTAGTPADHIGRFRAMADAGVAQAIVSLADVGRPGAIERFAPVIDAFR